MVNLMMQAMVPPRKHARENHRQKRLKNQRQAKQTILKLSRHAQAPMMITELQTVPRLVQPPKMSLMLAVRPRMRVNAAGGPAANS